MINRSRRRRVGCASIAMGCATAVALTGCSSPGGKAASSAPPPNSGAAPSSGRAAGGSPADAATTKAVAAAYATFFSNKSTAAQSQVVLQHGSSFTKTLAEQAKSSYAQKTTAKVTAVRMLGIDVAEVTFTITTNGTAVLPNSDGRAARENGTWKVAAQTFCGLLQLQGSASSACKDPKITALPN